MTEKEKKILDRLLIICIVFVILLVVGTTVGYLIYDEMKVTEYEAKKMAEKQAYDAAIKREMEELRKNRDPESSIVYINDKICENCENMQWLPVLVYDSHNSSGEWDGYTEVCPGCGYQYGIQEGKSREIFNDVIEEILESASSE